MTERITPILGPAPPTDSPDVLIAADPSKVLEIPLSEDELAGLRASAQTLHDAWASVQGT